MTIHLLMERLTQKIAEQCREIDRKSTEKFIECIMGAKRVFINGAGRSGLVARAFAMRLMHLGFVVYVVGETITPAIHSDDLLITLSGSGKTTSSYNTAKIAKEKGVKVVTITSHPESALGTISDCVIKIKGRVDSEERRDYTARQIVGEHEPITPLGTLFELSALVFLDSIVEELMRRQNKSEDEMKIIHTDLE